MEIKIALAGNPNCGKTTLFNALTGSNQFVGNWPGVTVEKKEGRLKKHNDVIITDLPGIYSLSPYTLEEVTARNYLTEENPDVILNILDGTNLERNLYLTTQLLELGIPVLAAVNMMDVVEKNGDRLDSKRLSEKLGCKVVEISALKGTAVMEAAEAAVGLAKQGRLVNPPKHSDKVEEAIEKIEDLLEEEFSRGAEQNIFCGSMKRFFAIKLFERDEKLIKKVSLSAEGAKKLERITTETEEALDDDAESIITDSRYSLIGTIVKDCYRKKNVGGLTVSDKIDKVVTNRIAALPIFALVMFIVYFLSVTTVGTWATDWVNDGLFGDGWFLFGAGRAGYDEAVEEYGLSQTICEAFEAASEDMLTEDDLYAITAAVSIYGESGEVEDIIYADYEMYLNALAAEEPAPSDYGIWVEGIPALIGNFLERINCADWINGLILDGIVAGVGAVLGFVPQMLVLFLFLAFLESCGYMARIAFVMDRIFRKFGLSGKSFIPMLIGTGCGVPGIMASRTIENDRDRKMTIMTTTFIPCGAKLPIIALIGGALLGDAWWAAPSAYFVGIAAIIISGIILKKTKIFAGDPAPFVMELPAYHMPTAGNVLRSMWERGWSFIKKAGTVIMLATIIVWFTASFGIADGRLQMTDMNDSILASLGSAIAWIFIPLGWGSWQGAVATITGLIAKENVVGTFGVLFGGLEEVAENGWQIWANMREVFTPLSAYSFLVFNLLCAPCFAAMGAIKREMNNAKWTAFAIGYQCVFAYAASLVIYQLGMLFTGNGNILGSAAAIIIVAFTLFMLFKPAKNSASGIKKEKIKVVR